MGFNLAMMFAELKFILQSTEHSSDDKVRVLTQYVEAEEKYAKDCGALNE